MVRQSDQRRFTFCNYYRQCLKSLKLLVLKWSCSGLLLLMSDLKFHALCVRHMHLWISRSHAHILMQLLQLCLNPFQTQIGISTRKMDRRITGHLCERNVENKCVPIILTYDQVGEHCHVFMLDFYISKMPQKMEYFYIRP